ncbi:MAG TPA: ABC transporter ATP-binding protein [Gammaproteobacteria bacterium]|jgi:capsular polysaccharide transport system ATP-binding protein|nr:ABC transporter ATP-binding protein [Gammaproteobacteria bacterium]
MIEIRNLTKSYRTKAGKKYVFKNLNAKIPTLKNVALLGRNGAGKSTLMRILGGIDHPDSGEVVSDQSISWPLALSSGFQGSLTGRENVKFVCRIYGTESELKEKAAWIKEFSGIGDYFEEQVKKYSSGMKSRLAFALSMAFKFDVYLVDEITAVGDMAFRKQSEQAFKDMRDRASIIMVAHNLETLRKQCDMGIVLEDGSATVFDDINEAIAVYKGEQLEAA